MAGKLGVALGMRQDNAVASGVEFVKEMVETDNGGRWRLDQQIRAPLVVASQLQLLIGGVKRPAKRDFCGRDQPDGDRGLIDSGAKIATACSQLVDVDVREVTAQMGRRGDCGRAGIGSGTR